MPTSDDFRENDFVGGQRAAASAVPVRRLWSPQTDMEGKQKQQRVAVVDPGTRAFHFYSPDVGSRGHATPPPHADAAALSSFLIEN